MADTPQVSDWCWVKSKSEGWAAKKGKGDWMFTQTELTRLEQDIVMLDHINEVGAPAVPAIKQPCLEGLARDVGLRFRPLL